MRRTLFFLSTILLAGAAVACSGSGGERTIPASPVAPGESNSANITAPVAESPSDDQQLDSVRPTLRVTNASSSGGGSRTYEFQISDSSGFASTAGAIGGSHPTTINLSGVPEGGDGRTSFTPQADLLPSTRYYWRARALQGASVGPWSNTLRFRTRVDSFKSGNMAFDILTDGRTVSDEQRNVSISGEGAKTNAEDSFLMYRLAALGEGEVSFIGWRVKPFNSGKLFTMQDGTGDFNSNPFRASVEKLPGGELRFTFAGNTVQSGGVGWLDNHDYYFKVEWRAGTARVRVYNGSNDAGGPFIELSTGYTAPYGAPSPVITMGTRTGDTMRDVRFSRVYIGPNARPVG